MKIYKSILVVSDLHVPYENIDTLAFLKAVKQKYKPEITVIIGDEVDYHDLSFHDSDKDLYSAGNELDASIEGLRPYYALFPEATILESNHGSMVLRKAVAHGLPRRVLKSYNEILEAPKGWKWVPNIILHTTLGPVFFTHGISSVPGKLSSMYGMSAVQGHFHSKAYVNYTSTPERLIFDMVVGCLIDDKSRAFAYNKLTMARPIISCGIIINGIPQIVPMVLNKNGRWIGKL
jgi:hypothetical protein